MSSMGAQFVIVLKMVIGAGTIIRSAEENIVKGLTTAGSLLFVAVIGITVAVGLYIVAMSATLFALVTLRYLGRLERLKMPGD